MPPSDNRSALPPHPHLANYYGQPRDRQGFVNSLFTRTAHNYDRIDRLLSFGTGPRYRRQALLRAGLQPGAAVLDVAAGTGLMSKEACSLVGTTGKVFGLDATLGMLREAKTRRGITLINALGERVPLEDESVDFLTVGYALRHFADLGVAFKEFERVMRPGGVLLILEASRPRRGFLLALLRLYMGRLVPVLSGVSTASGESALLVKYFWDTIEHCVPPEVILSALESSGFVGQRRSLVLGMFSEFTATKRTSRSGQAGAGPASQAPSDRI